MQGGFLIRHSRLTALGISLCVLAALFALEAKIAWFSPAGSANAQISFAKACPAEQAKALAQRFHSQALPSNDFAAAATPLAATLLMGAPAIVAVRPAPARWRVSASPGFSAALFFRPPPIR
jgi:hypothetical protein